MSTRNVVGDFRETFRLNGLHLKKADEAAVLADLALPERVLDTFLSKYGEIMKDVRLTTEGRLDSSRAAGRETTDAVETWHAPKREALDANEKRIRAEMRAAVVRPRPDDLGRVMETAAIRAEIRAAVAGLDDMEVEALARQGDPTVLDALTAGPRIVARGGVLVSKSFIKLDVLDDIVMRAAKKVHPDLGDALADVEKTRAVYASVAAAVARKVAELVSVEPEIKVLATKA